MKKILFALIVFALLIVSVRADDYTYGGEVDITGKVNYQITNTSSQTSNVIIAFTGLDNLINNQTIDRIKLDVTGGYLCEGETDQQIYYPEVLGGTITIDQLYSLTKVTNDKWTVSLPNQWLFAEGYNKFRFGFYVGNTCYKSSSYMSVSKDGYGNYLPIEGRYTINPEYAQYVIYQPGEEIDIRSIKVVANGPYGNLRYDVKYGIIKDLLILNDLKDNVSGVYERVIDYAKNDEDGISYNEAHINTSYTTHDYSNENIEKNAYYYFYIKFGALPHQYYNFIGTDGIVIMQGTDSDNPKFTTNVDYSKIATLNYAVDPDAQPNSGPGSTTDNEDIGNQRGSNNPDALDTVANPSTGLSVGIISVCILIILFVTIHKFNNRKIFKI